MNIVRFLGRSALAGFFVVNGLKAVRKPDAFAADAQPVADAFVPFARRTLPPTVSAYLPDDTAGLVRLNGAASLAGGLSMFTGIGRRTGAAMAAASMLPHVAASNPLKASPANRDAARSLFVRNLALLGAALIVTQDTQGNPSLLWRAGDAYARLQRQADRTGEQLNKEATRLARKAEKKLRQTTKSIEGALT